MDSGEASVEDVAVRCEHDNQKECGESGGIGESEAGATLKGEGGD